MVPRPRGGGLGREMRGALLIAKHEMARGLLSIRSGLILTMMLLLVGGGAYAISLAYNQDQLQTFNASVYKTPDTVLFLVSSFTALLVPIASVVLSFDALANERAKGTMALLLVKPLSRESLALGKYLGALGAVSFHIVVSSLVAIGLMTHVIGSAPSLLNSFLFIATTILLAGAYVGMTMVAAVKARGPGDAVMGGIAVWLLFTVFWLLLPMGVAFTMGWNYNVNDPRFLTFSNQADAFNPNGVYNLCLATSSGNEFFTLGVPPVAQALSLLLWFFVPLILFIVAFGRSEG